MTGFFGIGLSFLCIYIASVVCPLPNVFTAFNPTVPPNHCALQLHSLSFILSAPGSYSTYSSMTPNVLYKSA